MTLPGDPDIGPEGRQGGAAAASIVGDQLIKDLLDDAKIVAAYMLRAGLLKTNALPEAISALENTPVAERFWGHQAVVKLQIELNDAMRGLAPTTVDDLKGPGAPFSGSQRTLYNVAFAVVWALMIFFVALGTVSHNYGVSIVRSLEELKADDTGQKIEELVRSIVSGTNIPIENPVSADIPDDSTNVRRADFAISSPFLANFDEVKALDERTFDVVGNAKQFIGENFLVMAAISPFSTLTSILRLKNPEPLGVPPAVCDLKQQDLIAARYKRPQFGNTAMAGAIRYNDVEGLSLTCMAEFKYHLRDYPSLQFYIGTINLILTVYGLWLLPALYGALGASMYHLRRALDPALPTPRFLRTLNRTIMGSFAGIVIAWFWAPAAQANSELINVGFNLFVVAFLIGYSIDVFFTFLDRVLATATGSIRNLGTPES